MTTIAPTFLEMLAVVGIIALIILLGSAITVLTVLYPDVLQRWSRRWSARKRRVL